MSAFYYNLRRCTRRVNKLHFTFFCNGIKYFLRISVKSRSPRASCVSPLIFLKFLILIPMVIFKSPNNGKARQSRRNAEASHPHLPKKMLSYLISFEVSKECQVVVKIVSKRALPIRNISTDNKKSIDLSQKISHFSSYKEV